MPDAVITYINGRCPLDYRGGKVSPTVKIGNQRLVQADETSTAARGTHLPSWGPNQDLVRPVDNVLASETSQSKRDISTYISDPIEEQSPNQVPDELILDAPDLLEPSDEIIDAEDSKLVPEKVHRLEMSEIGGIESQQPNHTLISQDSAKDAKTTISEDLDVQQGVRENLPEFNSELIEESDSASNNIRVSDTTAIEDVQYPLDSRSYNLRSRRVEFQVPVKSAKNKANPSLPVLKISVKKALDTYGQDAADAIGKEVSQLHEKGVWRPIKHEDLPKSLLKKVIRSHMFIKAKYKPDGTFDKLKARLVAGGDMQDRSIYDESEISSPTVSVTAVNAIAAIAAAEGRKVVTADVTGAYLHAQINRKVYMRVKPEITQILAQKYPMYVEYIWPDGTLVLLLQMAMYGCVESSKLWYENITGLLAKHDFKINLTEPCVWNKEYRGDKAGNTDGEAIQLTVCIYVDDLMITCKDGGKIEQLLEVLRNTYGGITASYGAVHNYLGMVYNFETAGMVRISMEHFISDMFDHLPDIDAINAAAEATATTPAANDLFKIEERSSDLSAEHKAAFHSLAAKLLYLGKRVRPDILTAVSAVTSRVQSPNADDMKKLARLIKYLKTTSDLGLRLKASVDPVCITCWIDASYGVHGDCRSHSGLCISLGQGCVMARSVKQRINTKSSCEAELVAASDNLGEAMHLRSFLIDQGHAVDPIILFQDNMATMQLLENGKFSSIRSKHIDRKYFWIKDQIEKRVVTVQYTPTENMLADLFTKPLQGDKFVGLRNAVMNWNDNV